jgi:hypothetical protein
VSPAGHQPAGDPAAVTWVAACHNPLQHFIKENHMSVLNILVYVALIGYVMFKRVQGQPVKTPRRLFALPIILIILGYGDVTSGAALKPIIITLTVIAGAVSLGLGLLRGRADQLSDRNGSPFIKWGFASLILFVGNLVAKLVLDLIGIAAGGGTSAVGKSLLLTFGLTLLGEAIVVWMRTGGATGLLSPSRATAVRPRQPSTERFVDVTPPPEPSTSYQTAAQPNTVVPSREAVAPEAEPVGRSSSLHDGVEWLRRQVDQRGEDPASSTTPAWSLADAVEHHHNHHDHDHGHRHERERR